MILCYTENFMVYNITVGESSYISKYIKYIRKKTVEYVMF